MSSRNGSNAMHACIHRLAVIQSPMPKNIVVCCDGTANEFAKDGTNVVKLYYALEQDAAKQVTYYSPGAGNNGTGGGAYNVCKEITKLLGMAVGYGLSNDIR